MSRWLDRPGYVAALALAVGAAVAAVVLFLTLTRDGDDGADRQVVVPTTTATTPATTPTDAGGTATVGAATATPGSAASATQATFQDPDEALAAFVRDELESEYIDECPQQLLAGEPVPRGLCSLELYRSEELVTFLLGPPFSEFFVEAVLTRNEDGSWSVDAVYHGPLEATIALGSETVVFGAGSCLNFREEPGLSADAPWCLIDGTRGRVVEGPVEADEITWWRLEGLGWASEQYLRAVVE